MKYKVENSYETVTREVRTITIDLQDLQKEAGLEEFIAPYVSVTPTEARISFVSLYTKKGGR